jgi:hypothetical protein
VRNIILACYGIISLALHSKDVYICK